MTRKRAKKLLMSAGFDRNAANWFLKSMDRYTSNKAIVNVADKLLVMYAQQLHMKFGVRVSPISVHIRKTCLIIDWRYEMEASR